MITDKFLERLGGIVEGKKRSYRVEVKRKAPKAVGAQLDQRFEVIFTDAVTGDALTSRSQIFRMTPKDRISDLEDFVAGAKHSASNDFQ